jgi:hypothetical protein
LKRRSVLAFFQKLPPCLVGIEACASSHYGRANSRHSAIPCDQCHLLTQRPSVLPFRKSERFPARSCCQVALFWTVHGWRRRSESGTGGCRTPATAENDS